MSVLSQIAALAGQALGERQSVGRVEDYVEALRLIRQTALANDLLDSIRSRAGEDLFQQMVQALVVTGKQPVLGRTNQGEYVLEVTFTDEELHRAAHSSPAELVTYRDPARMNSRVTVTVDGPQPREQQ